MMEMLEDMQKSNPMSQSLCVASGSCIQHVHVTFRLNHYHCYYFPRRYYRPPVQILHLAPLRALLSWPISDRKASVDWK